MSLTAFSLHTRPHRRIFLARTIRQCCNSVSYSSTAGHQHNIFFGLGSLNRLLDGYLWFHTHFWVKIIVHAVLGATWQPFPLGCKPPKSVPTYIFATEAPLPMLCLVPILPLCCGGSVAQGKFRRLWTWKEEALMFMGTLSTFIIHHKRRGGESEEWLLVVVMY